MARRLPGDRGDDRRHRAPSSSSGATRSTTSTSGALQAAGLVVRQPRRDLVVRALGDRHRALGPQGQAARRARHAAPRRRAPRAAAGDREHASARSRASRSRPTGTPRYITELGFQGASSASARRARRGSARDRARRGVHAAPARAGRAGADADVGPGREHPHLGRRLRDPAHERARGARPDVDGGAVRAGRARCVSTAEVALLDADRLGRARVERRGVPRASSPRASPT